MKRASCGSSINTPDMWTSFTPPSAGSVPTQTVGSTLQRLMARRLLADTGLPVTRMDLRQGSPANPARLVRGATPAQRCLPTTAMGPGDSSARQ